MIRLIIALCGFVALVNGQSTPVSRCTAFAGELPIHAYIEGCDTPPCVVRHDTNAVVHLVFRAPHNIRRMRTLASAQMLTMFPHDLKENAETCNFLNNGFCPVMAGEVLSYTLKMYIETIFPPITVNIEFRIVDDDNIPFMCLRVPVRVRTALNTREGLNGTIIDLE
ncbi:NPC intracellular cholesterol transporter 2 homolog a-like [Anticarsia gemmatalis]|uniref:NPC intracellular cholesterol transporter 2 homolog a-like n=1 Tax=Anticarsia gemmatalis TaxID=129554 RepID=UPI003F771405